MTYIIKEFQLYCQSSDEVSLFIQLELYRYKYIRIENTFVHLYDSDNIIPVLMRT